MRTASHSQLRTTAVMCRRHHGTFGRKPSVNIALRALLRRWVSSGREEVVCRASAAGLLGGEYGKCELLRICSSARRP